MFFFIYKFGFSLLATALFLGAMIAWYTLYPRRFDSRVRKHLKKQMQESGYANMFGSYEININDDHLASVGPTGDSKHKWNAVNRAELSEEYLFVFLSGPQGLPIPVNEIGVDAARQACDAINQNVKNATI